MPTRPLLRTARARPRPRGRGGFTLVELVLVVVIVGVLAAIGWGSIQNQLPRYRLVEVAEGMASDIATLRMLSITANRETRLLLERPDPTPDEARPGGGAWRLQVGDRSANSASWEDLPLDADDGSDDERGEGPVDIGEGGNREAGGIGLAAWSGSDAVIFTPRGWVSNTASDFDELGYITLRLVNKRAAARGVEDEIHVRIARSGYVRLESTLGARLDAPVGTRGSSTDGP